MANSNEPGVFVKGNLIRVADTPSEAVALTFDGWKRQEAPVAEEPVVDETPVDKEPQKPEAPQIISPTPADVAKTRPKTTKDIA